MDRKKLIVGQILIQIEINHIYQQTEIKNMLVTTLIPAYKLKYLVPLLTCVRHQTVKPNRIIISDDTKQGIFIRALQTEPLAGLVRDMDIELISGPKAGAYANFRNLLETYSTKSLEKDECFHLMLDDDLIYPTFYEQHLKVHEQIETVCVISQRWVSFEDGQPIRDQKVPTEIKGKNEKILQLEKELLFPMTVGRARNWLGEFSNTTFRSEMASQLLSSEIEGVYYDGLEDLGAYLKSSLIKPIGYINENLGCFRRSAEQNSADTNGRPLKLAFLAYIALAIQSLKMNLIDYDNYYYAVNKAKNVILEHYSQQDDMKTIVSFLAQTDLTKNNDRAKFIGQWDLYRTAR